MSAGLYDLSMEQAVLGALLFDNGLLEHVPNLRGDGFYDPVHKDLFGEITRRIRQGHAVDAALLRAWWMTHPAHEDLGIGYLLTLVQNAAPVRYLAIQYADRLIEFAVRRALSFVASEIDILASASDVSADQLLLTAQRYVSQIDVEGSASDNVWKSAGEIAAEAVGRARKGLSQGISTGVTDLDAATGGGRPSKLWVVGGATSMGKSIVGQQFAVNVAKQGFGVAYIHLEMDAEEVGLRLAAALAFDRDNWRRGEGNPHYLSATNQKLTDSQWAAMESAASSIAPNLNIYVDDRPGRTVTQIESAVRSLLFKMKRDGVTPGLIVVDHEGLIAPEQRHPAELEAARARAHGLKDMAKRTGVWTVVLSQITKEGSRADGEDRLPQSTDLNYGSALSQAADVIILLHRKAYYAQRKPSSVRSDADMDAARSREVTLVVDKARGGRRAHVEALMDVASAVLIDRKDP